MKKLGIPLALLIALSIHLLAQETIPMPVKDNRFLIVEGTVNGRFQARFILDTGAGLELVSGKFFEKIKDSATPAGILTAFQSIGTRVDLELFLVPSLKIGNCVKKDLIVAPYADLDNYPGIDGLVSLKFFESQPFTLDFVSRNLILETPASMKALAAGAESLPIYESSFTGIGLEIFLPLLANGKVRMMTKFDTGTGVETMIHPYFLKALGIDPLSAGVVKRTFKNPDGSSQAWSVSQISSLAPVGSKLVEGTNLPANFFQSFIYEALIGWQLFKPKLVTIDIPNRRLLVRENPVRPKVVPPHVVTMFPANHAQNVQTGVREIFVEFDTDMSSMLCLNLFNDEQEELRFQNVYWKTDRILAIKVAGALKPHTRYTISLGIPDMCQLMDNFGNLFPVTQWSFTAGQK